MSPKGIRFSVGGRTDTGQYRQANEDHLFIDLVLGLFLVFDGGGSWSDEPSRVGPQSCPIIQRIIREGFNETDPRLLIKQAFQTADSHLKIPNGQGFSDGGSVALAFLREGSVHISWLGDAMVHHVSGGEIEPLTWPHNIANVMQRMGRLTEEVQERVKGYSQILCYCLGGGELPDPFEVVTFTPKPGDRLVLTTDGVHDVLGGSQFIGACQTHTEPQACANHLIELARERGSRDNCTCVVIAFE